MSNGDFFPIKKAFGEYMGRWYAGLYPDTPAINEFAARGLSRSVVWAPDRMVDAVESMLQAYQKNDNTPNPGTAPQPGQNALFPIVIVAMAKDYSPSGPDYGGRQVGRRLVRLEEGGSVYGYRQAMGDIRVQVVIMAAESGTARSLAAQFSLFIGEIPNRRFEVTYTWGQYTVTMPCLLEVPDIIFSNIQPEHQGMTILAADLNLRTVIPYFDAPRPGQPNDGTTNNPPGYPVVQEVRVTDKNTRVKSITIPNYTHWTDEDAEAPWEGVVYLNDHVLVLSNTPEGP